MNDFPLMWVVALLATLATAFGSFLSAISIGTDVNWMTFGAALLAFGSVLTVRPNDPSLRR